jgi:hypothetical protein
MNSKKQSIVITGAPSSGKSTTIDRLSTVLGNQATIVPESAVVLLSGGFPPPAHNDLEQINVFQQAIIQVQRGLELIFAKQNPNATVTIYDRGILDGAGFWPPGPEDYCEKFQIDIAQEYLKYNTVLFFELPEEKYYGGITPLRFHNYAQSVESEQRLKQVWTKHPHFILIKATEQFEDKIQIAISEILNCI